MKIELTQKEFRRLLDLVYIGNWILNSARGGDRFADYDIIQEKIFSNCRENGMEALIEEYLGQALPSKAYEDGGIHEAIADYEDAVFFDILAEELARRDMSEEQINTEDSEELASRIEEYICEFEKNGIENISLDI
ncbi:MAG: hypothetical protein FWG32_04120 [Oscillospiraceae bacterium]|nr:hypothetical protein [Oscillospiraceae bacterium]